MLIITSNRASNRLSQQVENVDFVLVECTIFVIF